MKTIERHGTTKYQKTTIAYKQQQLINETHYGLEMAMIYRPNQIIKVSNDNQL